MWLNPIPAETVLGAIIGAVLSTIMAQLAYFNVASVSDILFPLVFSFLILLFGVSAHFFCAAHVQNKRQIKLIFGTICLLTILVVIGLDPQKAHISATDGVQFLPRPGNFLMAGILALWFCALRALTELKRHTT